ncbi:DUF418 domain-containing protein [Nocardia sp. NPDC051030]|uniref:DUF418 domain-containing protein n=1 Tax=Nocardia sp. NPDC051030 TaxID=3155162 RepID=UPI003441E088
MESPVTPEDVSRGHGGNSLPRVLALDAARGIAVLGMFAVHAGPQRGMQGAELLRPFEGRSSALFAVLAGVSLALMSGGATPDRGLDGRRDLVRIAVRAVLIALVGLGLAQVHSGIGILIILTFYGLYFLLALPLLRLSARSLALLAAVWAVAGPILSFVIRSHMEQNSFGGNPNFGMFTSLSGLGELAEMLVITGTYPVLTWMPFVLAGMALGRLDIRSLWWVQVAGAGALLTVLGYGGSWLMQNPFGGRAQLIAQLRQTLTESGDPDDVLRQVNLGEIVDSVGFGAVPTGNWWWLTVDSPHSGTPFEVIGSTGVAFLVIGVLLAITPRAVIPLRSLISAGSCALTLYIGQVVALGVLVPMPDPDATSLPGGIHGPSWWLLALLVFGSLTLATLWRSVFRRGPAEWLLHRVTGGITRRLVPDRG